MHVDHRLGVSVQGEQTEEQADPLAMVDLAMLDHLEDGLAVEVRPQRGRRLGPVTVANDEATSRRNV